MNKKELIAAVAEKADVTKKDAEAVVKATLETITAAIADRFWHFRRSHPCCPHRQEPPYRRSR